MAISPRLYVPCAGPLCNKVMAGEGCPAAGKKVMKSLPKCDFTQNKKMQHVTFFLGKTASNLKMRFSTKKVDFTVARMRSNKKWFSV